MTRNREEFKQLVYDLMCGSIDRETFRGEEVKVVENAYAEGSECDRIYQEVYEACERVCERLGTAYGEDEDVERIMDGMLEIQGILCRKMFEYGGIFAGKDTCESGT